MERFPGSFGAGGWILGSKVFGLTVSGNTRSASFMNRMVEKVKRRFWRELLARGAGGGGRGPGFLSIGGWLTRIQALLSSFLVG